MEERESPTETDFHPLTIERWFDFELLCSERGVCGGSHCVWWRLSRSEFSTAEGRR